VIVRAFNHVGPRQGLGFVWSDVARQVAQVERGSRPPILEVGTTTTWRDFTDVRDMVRAYWLLLARSDVRGTYNASSGKATSIQEVIESFLARAARPIEVRQVAQRVRPIDVPMLVGDASRLRQLTGWAPTIPLQQSIEDVLDDWRQRV
jgi:GDP-4-dehydro-6-deoxy-D-mannose reductase